MTLIATVTLPDGTPAVVHQAEQTWDKRLLAQYGRDALCRQVTEELFAIFLCVAGQASSVETLTVTPDEKDGLRVEARALCAAASCRTEAEQYEQQLAARGQEHPETAEARAWAARSHAATTGQG
ncbi:hypothetical protein [Streptomyces nanshensis]|uniref:Uncharacterized protein n=1 Tax=Streptomyces nanshensis TaxID=518642 RepID=A0A1E7L9S4_9ACTN|nr:hypothetical protein [Streptomyces nanshensis]OEV12985.1 hypothetical protein AN218_05600 [Streptomyces nanshensis]